MGPAIEGGDDTLPLPQAPRVMRPSCEVEVGSHDSAARCHLLCWLILSVMHHSKKRASTIHRENMFSNNL